MKKNFVYAIAFSIIAVLVILAVLVLPGFMSGTQPVTPDPPGPLIKLVPSKTTVAPGEEFTVSVDVKDVENIFGYQATILYNPAVIDALTEYDSTYEASMLVGQTEGDFLKQGSDTSMLKGRVKEPGKIEYIVGSKLRDVPGASGSGTLATVTLIGKAAGSSTLSLSNVQLVRVVNGKPETTEFNYGNPVTITVR